MKVETIKHTDVRGKVLNYLKITNGEKQVLINIGDKTFETVSEVIKDELNEITKPKKDGKPTNKMV